MRGFRKVSILPVLLDRSYGLKERLSVWFYGETYQSRYEETRLKPYAIYRKFNKNGYCNFDPYYDTNPLINPIAERRFYERNGLVFKSEEAKKIYHNDRAATRKYIFSLKHIKKSNIKDFTSIIK